MGRILHSGRVLLAVMSVVLLGALAPRAGSFVIFGPQTLTRTTGAPNVFNYTFTAATISVPYTLRIDNHGIDSAVVTLNGVQVLGPSDFKSGGGDDWRKAADWADPDWNDATSDHSTRALIQRTVTVRASNTI